MALQKADCAQGNKLLFLIACRIKHSVCSKNISLKMFEFFKKSLNISLRVGIFKNQTIIINIAIIFVSIKIEFFIDSKSKIF